MTPVQLADIKQRLERRQFGPGTEEANFASDIVALIDFAEETFRNQSPAARAILEIVPTELRQGGTDPWTALNDTVKDLVALAKARIEVVSMEEPVTPSHSRTADLHERLKFWDEKAKETFSKMSLNNEERIALIQGMAETFTTAIRPIHLKAP